MDVIEMVDNQLIQLINISLTLFVLVSQ